MRYVYVCDICGKKIGHDNYIELKIKIDGGKTIARRHYACHQQAMRNNRSWVAEVPIMCPPGTMKL